MTTELELAQMLDQFVDDLNNGVTPRIYELMASGFGAADDLIPLLDLAAQFKASTVQMPANEKERVKAQVLEVAQAKPAVQVQSDPARPTVVASNDGLEADTRVNLLR